MKARIPVISRLALSVLLCVAGLARAADGPAKPPPLTIVANQVEINDKTGISTYKGDVKVTRGRVHLNCDTLIIHRVKGEVQRADCQGGPATFRRLAGDGQKEIHGHSKRVEYYTEDEHLVLLGDAFLQQENDHFSSQHIVYYIERDVVHAGSPGNGGGRVHITIHPKESGSAPKDNAKDKAKDKHRDKKYNVQDSTKDTAKDKEAQ